MCLYESTHRTGNGYGMWVCTNGDRSRTLGGEGELDGTEDQIRGVDERWLDVTDALL